MEKMHTEIFLFLRFLGLPVALQQLKFGLFTYCKTLNSFLCNFLSILLWHQSMSTSYYTVWKGFFEHIRRKIE